MRRLLPIIILFIVAFLISKPFFKEGFFPTHDGEWAVVRMAEMQREIKDGQIPPRWAGYLNHGYGYPLFSFTYPLPYYLGMFFRIFHLGLVDTVKAVFILSVFLSAVSMFLLGRELVGDIGGFIAAVFYTVAPYRLVNLYVRGSLGESLSLAIFPLLLLLSFKYILKPTAINLVLSSVVLALFILAHNITALIFFPFWIIFLYVILFTYFEDVKKYTIRYFPPLIILGLGLSAYFFIPALFEKKYILLSQIKLADISENFIKLSDYLFSPWNYGIKPSFQLGWAHILGAFLGLVSIFISNKLQRKKYRYFAPFIIIGIGLSIFFTLSFSEKFWAIAPLSWIDFPWRLMTVITFFLAFSAMFLAIHRVTKIIGIILVVIIIFFSLKFAKPAEYFNKGDEYYATNDATTTSMDELMPIWVIDKPKNRYQSKIEVVLGNITVNNLRENSVFLELEALFHTPTTLKINTVYFPGWRFYINGEEAVIKYNQSDGLIRLSVPSGRHKITGKFSETPIRLTSDLITLVSLVISLSLICYSIFRKLNIEKS